MKEFKDVADEYRNFICSKIGFEYDVDGSCCKNFVYEGPKVSKEEKAEIVSSVRGIGLNDLADYIEDKNNISVNVKGRVSSECHLIDKNICHIHKVKPKACKAFPVYVYEKNKTIVVEIDTACKHVSNKYDINKEAEIIEEFKDTFDRDLVITTTNSIEERIKRFYGD